MREVNAVSEPMLVRRGTAAADVTSKDVAEALLQRLDQPRNRGGRRIQSNTPDGVLEVWRSDGRVYIKHPRLRKNEKGEKVDRKSSSDEISLRLERRGNYLKSAENIFVLRDFLENNEVALSYLKVSLT
jgi:hypothetical protein